MPWRHDNYRTACRTCTLVGNLRVSTDEEGNVRSSWAGVRQSRIHHASPRNSVGVCDGCGSSDIAIEAPIRLG
jgi:hypothetical protein